jgi:hypothetical protein
MTAPGFLVPAHRSSRSPTYLWKAALLCVAVSVPAVMAQDVLAPPPAPPPLVPSAVEQYQTNQAAQMRAFAPPAPPAAENEPFKAGPFVIRPFVSYQFLYGNGLDSSPGQQQNSIVQTLTTGVAIQEGSHWTLNYTPSFTFYSSSAFQNTINQNVDLQWGTTWRDWVLGASQGYSYSDNPQIETGGQTAFQTYSTAVNGTYAFNDRISTLLGLNQSLIYVGNSSTNLALGLVDTRGWSTMDWLNDQLWPRLSAGIGLGAGYNQQQDSPDSIYQQFQAQLNWRLTDKISFQLSGGLQEMEYLSGGASDLLTPIFTGGLQYQPFEQTKFSVSASRTVSTSPFENETIESTVITGDLNQRFFGWLTLDLNGGYSSGKFLASSASLIALSTARNDDVYSFNATLSCPFPKRGTVSIFYEYSQDTSTQNGFVRFGQYGFSLGSSAFSYSSSQFGFDISYTY